MTVCKTGFMHKWFRTSYLIFSLVLAAISDPVQGQTTVSSFDSLYQYSITDVPADIVKVIVSPLKWDKKDWLMTGALLGSTGLAMTADKPVAGFFTNNNNLLLNDVSKYGLEPWGSGVYLGPAIAIAFTTGLISHDKKLQFAAYKSAEAWLLAAGATQVAKQVFHRHRPYESPDEPFIFDGPGISHDYLSFPSGHTSTAFATATVWARIYADKPWVGVLSYSLATMIGLSRIHDRQHWLSDVMAGAAVGYWIGSTLVPSESRKRGSLTFSPCIGDGYYRIALCWNPR